MLFNSRGQVWVGRRVPKWLRHDAPPIWQMPQGGIEKGESPIQAAVRELAEETGVQRADVIGEVQDWLTYELPPELLGIALKGRYRGQSQRWFAMRFNGDDSEIHVSGGNGRKPEFDDWKWVAIGSVADEVSAFKQALYRSVAGEFQHLAG